MKVVLFQGLAPFTSARLVEPQVIREEFGSIEAAAILDGTHPRWRAVYQGVFMAQLEALSTRLKSELEA